MKRLKILLAHNFYGSIAPSGENSVYEAELELLRSRGHEVIEFTRNSDEIRRYGWIGTARVAASVPWNPFALRALRRVLRARQPDVMHVHNSFPLLSPAIFYATRGIRTAAVLTLHNYRLFCPAAIPMRSGAVCTECLDQRSVLPSLRYGCYRQSRIATAPLAMSVALHRQLGTWQQEVNAFVVLSEFQRRRMVQAGLPLERVVVKPNFYPGSPVVQPWMHREPYVVFAGRLSAEKGLISLLQAWQLWGAQAPELRILGDGELRPQLQEMAHGLPIRFMGQLSGPDAEQQIAGAQLLVLPSECFEGFPMVVREAFAFGTAVAVSNLGPLPSIVQEGVSGVVFEPGNPASLHQVVQGIWQVPGGLEKLGRGARQAFEANYTEESNYEMLRRVYEQAIKHKEQVSK